MAALECNSAFLLPASYTLYGPNLEFSGMLASVRPGTSSYITFFNRFVLNFQTVIFVLCHILKFECYAI